MTEVSQKSDQSLLRELNAQFIKNFLTQDTSSHNKIIHKDFICIESSGQIVDREIYMENWTTDYANDGYVTSSYSDEAIRIFGNMALVRSRANYSDMVNGKTFEGNTMYIDTYIKENVRRYVCRHR